MYDLFQSIYYDLYCLNQKKYNNVKYQQLHSFGLLNWMKT